MTAPLWAHRRGRADISLRAINKINDMHCTCTHKPAVQKQESVWLEAILCGSKIGRRAPGEGIHAPVLTFGRCNGRPMRQERRYKKSDTLKVLARSCVVVRRQVLEHPLHVCAEGVCFVSRSEFPTTL